MDGGTYSSGALLVVFAFAAGCADSRSDVTGTVVGRFYDPSGQRDVPADLTGYRYQVYAGDELIPAAPVAGTANGTFRIAGVPEGPFLLRIEKPNGHTSWEQHDQHAVSTVWDYVGHPDAIAATGSVPLALQMTGLSPWASGDLLVVNCWENGTEHMAPMLSPPMANGASAIDATLDWNTGYSFGPSGAPYLMNPGAGDTLTISRLSRTSPQSGITVLKLTQLATGAGVALNGTEPARFSGSFTDVPLATSQHFVVDLDGYAEALPALPVAGGWGISLLKNPAAEAGTIIGPPLLSVESSSYAGAWMSNGRFDFSDTHGTPFDANWPTMVRAGYEVHLPGTTGPFGDEPRYYAYTNELVRSPDHVVSVFAGFVRSVAMDEQALEQGTVAHHAVTPLRLAVDLPASAQRFTLVLSQRVPVGNTTTLVPRISITSSLPELELPASAVQPGEYFASIWATSDDGSTHSGAYRDVGTFVLQ